MEENNFRLELKKKNTHIHMCTGEPLIGECDFCFCFVRFWEIALFAIPSPTPLAFVYRATHFCFHFSDFPNPLSVYRISSISDNEP